MQTFLPYQNAWASARCLDNKRLGKQRVECKQILLALGVDVGQHRGNPSSRWRNHPAVQMWRGHELLLAEYAEVMCLVWQKRGFADTLREQFRDCARRLTAFQVAEGIVLRPPRWLGHDRLHASHRSNLLRKDATHYGQFGWQEPDDLPYWWPTQQGAVA